MSRQILLQGVSKIYESNGLPSTALQDVTLGIDQGEFTVIAGPSGSGKSTILHLIGALDQPSQGRVWAVGEDLAQLSHTELSKFRLNKIGFVFQAYNLIPVLTAQENVEYPLLLQGLKVSERKKRSHELLEKVGLKDHAHKRPTQMSGGQQQRVAVARALVTKPEIILADEPTANLDSQTGELLIELFSQLNKEYNTTFVMASHDPEVIGQATRVVRLKDGRVLL